MLPQGRFKVLEVVGTTRIRTRIPHKFKPVYGVVRWRYRGSAVLYYEYSMKYSCFDLRFAVFVLCPFRPFFAACSGSGVFFLIFERI